MNVTRLIAGHDDGGNDRLDDPDIIVYKVQTLRHADKHTFMVIHISIAASSTVICLSHFVDCLSAQRSDQIEMGTEPNLANLAIFVSDENDHIHNHKTLSLIEGPKPIWGIHLCIILSQLAPSTLVPVSDHCPL